MRFVKILYLNKILAPDVCDYENSKSDSWHSSRKIREEFVDNQSLSHFSIIKICDFIYHDFGFSSFLRSIFFTIFCYKDTLHSYRTQVLVYLNGIICFSKFLAKPLFSRLYVNFGNYFCDLVSERSQVYHQHKYQLQVTILIENRNQRTRLIAQGTTSKVEQTGNLVNKFKLIWRIWCLLAKCNFPFRLKFWLNKLRYYETIKSSTSIIYSMKQFIIYKI